MIAHHQTTKHHPSIDKTFLTVIPELYIAIVILQVGSIAVCTDIAPLAHNRATQKSVVCFVAVANDDGITDFATHLGVGSDGNIAPHLCAHVQLRSFAHGKRASDKGTLLYNTVLAQINRTRLCIQYRCVNMYTLL